MPQADTPFCSFMSFVRTGDDKTTVENGLRFLQEIIESLNTTVRDHVGKHLIKLTESLDTLSSRVKGVAFDGINRVAAITDNLNATAATTIKKTLDAIAQTTETVAAKAPQTIDFFPLALQEVPAQAAQPPAVADKDKPKPIAWPIKKGTGPYYVYGCQNAGKFILTNDVNSSTVDCNTVLFKSDDFESSLAYLQRATLKFQEEAKAQGKPTDVQISDFVYAQKQEMGTPESRFKRTPEDIASQTKRALVDSDWLGWLPDWTKELACEALKDKGRSDVGDSNTYFARQLNLRTKDGKILYPKWLRDANQEIGWLPEGVFVAIGDFLRFVVDNVDDALFEQRKAASCSRYTSPAPYLARAIMGVIHKWTGVEMPKLEESVKRVIDFDCPTEIPSPAETDDLYLKGLITKDVWECWTRANNIIPNHHEKVLVAVRERQNANDLIDALFRKEITRVEFDERMRALGWLEQDEVDLAVKLRKETPTPSDIIEFMLRDVFDQAVVKEFGYSDEFAKKFTGESERLADAVGLSKDIALLHWQAHWKMPSNTQLYEMYHRLRGGKGGSGYYSYFDSDGNKLATPRELSKEELKITEEQVARALGINDVLPFFQQRMLAISRPPLTRTDVKRAFDIGAVTEDVVYESYRDLGYDDANAKTLTNFAVIEKKRKDVRRQGRLLPSRISAMYASSTITMQDALSELEKSGLSKEEATSTLQSAVVSSKAKARAKCIASIRRRFMLGDIDRDQIVKMLTDAGLDHEQALMMRTEWACELSYKTKEVTAQQLCDFFKSELISKEDFVKRLVRIGYPEKDAEKIAGVCEQKKEEADAKKATKKKR